MKHFKNIILLEAIALTLKYLRSTTGKTQEEVNDEISILINQQSFHIGRLETAQINSSVSIIYELCKYYKISSEDFFKEVEKNKLIISKKINK
jgi:transcriptional regulator with XRE-family HTH domain